MKPQPRSYKNRTLRIPAELLRRVQVKLAQEDRKLNGLVVEQLSRWAGDLPGGGLTPGQRFVSLMAQLRRKGPFRVPRTLDKALLMGERNA